MSIRNICVGTLLALSGIFISGSANAQGAHPYYHQALSDLNAARQQLLQYIGGNPMTHNEKEALREINEIIREMNAASIAGNPEPNKQPAGREGRDNAARLHQCIEFLKKAKNDLSHDEDSQFANGLRDRSVKNCDEAIKFVQQAMHG